MAFVVPLLFASCAMALDKPAKDENHVYLLSSAAELAWFRDQVNEGETELNARLVRDIDLGGHAWSPIGDRRRSAFNGVFDGGGHYVRGLYVNGEFAYAGLFGCVGYGGMAENILVEGARMIVRGVSDISAGVLTGANHGVIQNCIVMRSKLFVEDLPGATASMNVSAVAGLNDEGIILHSFAEQCVIWARLDYSIGGRMAIGGLSGMNLGTQPGMGLVQNCSANDNHIRAEARGHGSDAYSGGLLGLALGGMVRRCSNTDGIVENVDFMGSSSALGGIIGSSMLGSYLEHCAVGAEVQIAAHGGTEPSSAGGIAGSLVGSNVDGCTVEGAVITGSGDLAHCLGGIAGAFAGGKISNCLVSAAELPNDPEAPYRVGAVAGVTFEVEIIDSTPQTLIENTYFEQDIAGGRPVGSDSNPENTSAIPYSKGHEPSYSIDSPEFSGDDLD